jgi:large subunit ribosomal protein L21
MASSYAIVESGGKQYRAEKGASLLVEHLSADEGAKVNLRAVMYRGDKEVVLNAKELEKVKVEAVVAEHLRGAKVRVFKYKPKKGYRRRSGHRQELTRLEVTDVRLLTRKPAAKAEAKPAEKKAEAKPAEKKAEAKPAGENAAAKPAEEKAEAKPKAAPRKPAAKKPAAKAKPAATKPAAKGKAQPARKPSSASRRSSSAKKS